MEKVPEVKKIKCDTSTCNTFLNVLQLPYLKAKKERERKRKKKRYLEFGKYLKKYFSCLKSL